MVWQFGSLRINNPFRLIFGEFKLRTTLNKRAGATIKRGFIHEWTSANKMRWERLAIGIAARKYIWMLTFFVVALRPAWSQTDNGQPPADSEAQDSASQSNSDTNAAPPATETSPISGLPQSTTASAGTASPSFLLAGLHLSEGPESDPSGTSGVPSQLSSLTSVLGSLNLVKLRRRSETALDYSGGVTVESDSGVGTYIQQLHQLDASHRILWRRVQLTLADSLSDLRGGNFGSPSFGGASAYNLRFPGSGASAPSGTGTTQVGLNQESYISNVSGVALAGTLTARSSISLDGTYSITDYLGNSQSLVNGRQTSIQAGYNYQLNPKDGIGLVYGYQTFQFSESGAGGVITNSVQFVYRRRVSSRMNLVLGAGPQISQVTGGIDETTQQADTAVHASLSYLFRKSSLTISYARAVTSGYGLFAGGNSNIAQFSISRAISRSWQGSVSAGYATVSSLQPATDGVSGSSYDYGFVGMAVQRQLRHRLDAFASYQFNDESSFCGAVAGCAPRALQHIVQIGLDWNFRAARLE